MMLKYNLKFAGVEANFRDFGISDSLDDACTTINLLSRVPHISEVIVLLVMERDGLSTIRANSIQRDGKK